MANVIREAGAEGLATEAGGVLVLARQLGFIEVADGREGGKGGVANSVVLGSLSFLLCLVRSVHQSW